MNTLPHLLRRAPYLLYALGLILGGWRFLNEWTAIETTYSGVVGGFDDPAFNQAHSIGRSAAIYWGVVEGVYLCAYGAMIQVLIAIYDKVRGSGE